MLLNVRLASSSARLIHNHVLCVAKIATIRRYTWVQELQPSMYYNMKLRGPSLS